MDENNSENACSEARKKAHELYLNGMRECNDLSSSHLAKEHNAQCLVAQAYLIKNIDDIPTAKREMATLKKELKEFKEAMQKEEDQYSPEVEAAKKIYYDGMRKIAFTESSVVTIAHMHGLFRKKAFDSLMNSCDDMDKVTTSMTTLTTAISKFVAAAQINPDLEKKTSTGN